MTPEAIYQQLGQLMSQVPEFGMHGSIDNDTMRWIAKVGALVEQTNSSVSEMGNFRSAADHLGGTNNRQLNAHTLVSIAQRALARLELSIPASAQGMYIPVGHAFDTLQTLAKILESAQSDALIVDPYLDRTVLLRYGQLVKEGINLRLLGNKMPKWSDGLKLAVDAFAIQHGATRPIEYRHAPQGDLHDRLIILDQGREGWNIGQSVKDIAAKSPTAFIRLPEEVRDLKSSYYERSWANATAAT